MGAFGSVKLRCADLMSNTQIADFDIKKRNQRLNKNFEIEISSLRLSFCINDVREHALAHVQLRPMCTEQCAIWFFMDSSA